MSLNFEWFGVAEAVARDSRGARVVVGLDMNVTIAPRLPTQIRRVLIAIVRDTDAGEAILPGKELVVDISITGPSGETLVKTQLSGPPATSRHQGIPAAVSFETELQFTASEYGTYVAHCDLKTSTGEEISATKKIHVLSPELGTA